MQTVYALEHTMRSLTVDTWRGLTYEIVAVLKFAGIVTVLSLTAAIIFYEMFIKLTQIKSHAKVYGESIIEAAGFRSQLPVSSNAGFEKPTHSKFD